MINNLPEKLKEEITQYCKLNNIEDVNSFIIKLIKQSLTIEKFGYYPEIFKDKIKVEQPKVEVKEPEKVEEVMVVKNNIEPEIKEEVQDKKNEYKIDLDLNKKENINTTEKIDDDIYGEGKGGWFGGSNLYELIKRKK